MLTLTSLIVLLLWSFAFSTHIGKTLVVFLIDFLGVLALGSLAFLTIGWSLTNLVRSL